MKRLLLFAIVSAVSLGPAFAQLFSPMLFFPKVSAAPPAASVGNLFVSTSPEIMLTNANNAFVAK